MAVGGRHADSRLSELTVGSGGQGSQSLRPQAMAACRPSSGLSDDKSKVSQYTIPVECWMCQVRVRPRWGGWTATTSPAHRVPLTATGDRPSWSPPLRPRVKWAGRWGQNTRLTEPKARQRASADDCAPVRHYRRITRAEEHPPPLQGRLPVASWSSSASPLWRDRALAGFANSRPL